MEKFEYGIAFWTDVGGMDFIHDTHRTGMTREEAEKWIAQYINWGGSAGAFVIIKRELHPWKIADDTLDMPTGDC